jgi:hypothetical protein
MTIGAVGSVGGPIYIPDTNRVYQNERVDFSQVNTQDYVRHDTETIRPVEDFQPDTGERPDFAAINLMRNSFPEPMPEARVQNFSLEDFETGASSRPEQQQMTLADFQQQQAQAAQAQASQNTQSVHDAVAEQDAPAMQGNTGTTNAFALRENTPEPQTLSQEVRVEQQVAESATVQTSYEIANENAGNQLTPAQQQGYQEYERVQNYVDPVSVSVAGSQIVA